MQKQKTKSRAFGRYGMLSVDEKTARSSLPAHFSRLGFRSLAGAPLQKGAKVCLRGLSTTELNGVQGAVQYFIYSQICSCHSFVQVSSKRL
jgi:hypothetical protein